MALGVANDRFLGRPEGAGVALGQGAAGGVQGDGDADIEVPVIEHPGDGGEASADDRVVRGLEIADERRRGHAVERVAVVQPGRVVLGQADAAEKASAAAAADEPVEAGGGAGEGVARGEAHETVVAHRALEHGEIELGEEIVAGAVADPDGIGGERGHGVGSVAEGASYPWRPASCSSLPWERDG